ASQLGVAFDVGPQVLQNVLGAVLADGQAAGGQNVRHVAGADLRVQPGQAGVVVLVGVVLGVVNDLDAVVLVGAVELQDGVADVVVQVHAAVGQYRLVRQDRGVGLRQDGQLVGIAAAPAPAVGHGHHPAVFQEGEEHQVPGVDVGVDQIGR